MGGLVLQGFALSHEREAAIEKYERSLELDPENENALSKLKELRGQ